MKPLSILGGLVLASSIQAQTSGWEATAEQVCIPDFRPAEDGIVLDGAAYDVVADGELTLAIDGDADGRGDRLLRLRPEDPDQLPVLHEVAAEAIEFEFFAWGSAAKTIRLGAFGGGPSTWLVVRTPNCPLPDDWVEGRNLLMLEALTWIETPDGPELGLDDPPRPARMAETLARYGHLPPEQCQAGGPGAMSCGLTIGEGGCYAACADIDQYACCTPVACGCEPVDAGGD
jgi:hypothetical protein